MYCQYLLLFVAAASVGRVTCWKVVIKNPYSGYVLDGTEHEVKLQPFKGTPQQYWSVLQVADKAFYFMNKGNRKFLDIEGKPDSKANVITSEPARGEKQKWIKNSDDLSIVSFQSNNLVLDIKDNDIKPGASIIVYPYHEGRNQKFILEPAESEDD